MPNPKLCPCANHVVERFIVEKLSDLGVPVFASSEQHVFHNERHLSESAMDGKMTCRACRQTFTITEVSIRMYVRYCEVTTECPICHTTYYLEPEK
jgi:uncharacterized protein YbaR (Trm112 family)